jgi:hypothetical protein
MRELHLPDEESIVDQHCPPVIHLQRKVRISPSVEIQEFVHPFRNVLPVVQILVEKRGKQLVLLVVVVHTTCNPGGKSHLLPKNGRFLNHQLQLNVYKTGERNDAKVKRGTRSPKRKVLHTPTGFLLSS